MLDNRFFHALYDHSPLGMIIFDIRRGSVVQLNRSAARMLGYRFGDFRGFTMESFVHPSDWPGVSSSSEQIRDACIPEARLTARLKHWSKDFVNVDLTLSSVITSEEVGFLVFTFQLVKENKNPHSLIPMVSATRPSTWKIAHTLAGIAVWEMDLHTGLIEWSDASCLSLELVTKVQFSYSDFLELVHSDDREVVSQCWESALAKGTVYDLMHRIVCKGQTKWVRMQCKFESDSNGKPIRAVGVIKDITEKKIAKDQLEKRDKDLRQVMSALDQSSLVTIVDPQGIILRVNERFCEVSKYGQQELIGKRHSVLNSGFHDEKFWKHFWSTIKRGKVWRGEIRNRAKDGSIYWVYTTINPIYNESGQVVHYLTIRQDITSRKIYEELLLQVNARLAQIEEFINFTSDAIQVCDPEGTFIYINEVASQRLGIPRDDCERYNITHFDFLFHNRAEWRACVSEAKRVGSVNIEAMHSNRALGTVFPAEATIRYTAINGKDYVVIVSRDISERRKNELALKESQARLAEAQRIARLGYWEWSLHDDVIWWSDEQYNMYGLSRSTVPFTLLETMQFVHPDDRTPLMQTLENTLETGAETSVTFRLIRTDGEIRLILAYTSRIADDQGTPHRLRGVNLDITDRIKTEQALRESEETLRKAQRAAKIGSWKLNVSVGELEWSAETYRIFGIQNNKKLTYADFLTLVHPEDKELVANAWRATLNGEPYDIVHRIIVDNKVKWVREHAEITVDEHRKLTYGFGIVQDITDHKNLQDSHEIFNQSLLLTGIGSWCASLHNKSLFLSNNVYSLHGLSKDKDSINFENYLDLILQEDRDRIASTINDMLIKRGSFETEYRVKKADGTVQWLSVHGKVLKDEDGNAREVYGIVRDITAEKHNTAELIQARKEAEEAAYIKDQFLSIMSHEIRTPLNSVIGLSNLILKRDPRQDQLEIMRILKGSADNLLHLVNDILDFNKIRAGKLELELIPFSLSVFLKQIHASFKLTAQDKGVIFNIQIDPRIPDVLLGDVTRLNQIFINLVGNAIKFTHKGYVRFNVELKGKDEDNICRLLFKIEDTGVGIPPEKIKSIFQPFQQSESDTSRKYGGTGLGLSIVKSLVQILNGEIHISSTPGKGSVFSVELAVIYSPAMTVEDERPVRALPEPAYTSKERLKVLYVEDVESNRFLISNLLSDYQIDTVAVSSGRAALQATRRELFQLILMDIQMPSMDGYETTRRIRKQMHGKNRSTPVLAFTAEPYSEELKKKVADHSIGDLITKPFDAEMLIDKIIRLTETHQRSRNYFSFSFYENALGHDKTRLKEIKRMVIQDVKRFSTKLRLHARTRNEAGLKAEIHRIRPIIKKIECQAIIDSLDKYKISDYSEEEMNKLHSYLKQLLSLLTELPY